MKRTYIGEFHFLGAGMCELPVKVWLSHNKETQLWTLFYRFTDSEQPFSVNEGGLKVEGVFQSVASRGIQRKVIREIELKVLQDERKSKGSKNSELAELATALRRLLEEPIADASSSGCGEKPTEEPNEHAHLTDRIND